VSKQAERTWQKAIVLGDIHIPYHDPVALNMVYDFIEVEEFDLVILIGDIEACYEMSKFAKDKVRGIHFADEALIVKANLRQLRKSVGPDARIVYVCGNHEHRLQSFLMKDGRALQGVEGNTIPEVFGFKEFGIQWVPCNAEKFHDTYWQFEGYEILFGHFNRLAKHSAYCAKNIVDDYGISLIQGHVHSMGFHERKMERGYVGGWENGCLCDLNPIYMKQKNWMQGFHIVHFETPGRFFDVEAVRIINHQFMYGGQLWLPSGGGKSAPSVQTASRVELITWLDRANGSTES